MLHKRIVSYWLYSISVLVLMIVAVGGITRLTGSGLSIVEWKPLMGAIPPLNHAEWLEVFNKYQQSPQFKLVNLGMSLEQFQWIFFWEYIHRLIARFIGVIFFVPFVFFLAKKYFNKSWVIFLLGGFALGGMQGFMGWCMVASGLVNEPRVSHFRLAAHLILATIIFSYFLWLGFKWNSENSKQEDLQSEKLDLPQLLKLKKSLNVLILICILQIFYGALVAGLRAGYISGTFPLMDGHFFPAGGLMFEPLWLNFLNNPLAVQWAHRCLAWFLYLSIFILWIYFRKKINQSAKGYFYLLFIWINFQFALGISVIFTGVYLPLAVLHQVGAFLVLTYLFFTRWHLKPILLNP